MKKTTKTIFSLLSLGVLATPVAIVCASCSKNEDPTFDDTNISKPIKPEKPNSYKFSIYGSNLDKIDDSKLKVVYKKTTNVKFKIISKTNSLLVIQITKLPETSVPVSKYNFDCLYDNQLVAKLSLSVDNKPDPEPPIVDPEKPIIPDPPVVDPEKPIIPDPPVVDPDLPIMPNSQHSLSKELMLNAKNQYQILKETDNFKNTVKEIERRMYAENWDFRPYFMYKDFKEFVKLNNEVGIMSEYGKNEYERMKFAAKDVYLENDMKQKLLPNFESFESFNATDRTQDINQIILNNQFGYLPSNLSQFLYYVNLKGISEIFNIPNSYEIKMNFDDENGTAEILIYDNNKNKYLFKYNSNDSNCELKNNNYFRQYIFERSFVIQFPRLAYTKQVTEQTGTKYQNIENFWQQGTGWLLDRITNQNTPEGYYDFLVGTNLHVLDLSRAYNKERSKVNPANSLCETNLGPSSDFENTYDKKWDGGILTLKGENSDTYENDQIITVPAGNGFFQYQAFKDNKRLNAINSLIIKRDKVNNNDNNLAGEATNHFNLARTQLNSENFISDTVQYTPTFKTKGVYMDKSDVTFPVFDLKPGYKPNSFIKKDTNGKEYAYDEWEGYRVGSISNAGADFAITKIRISKQDVKTLFPTLYPLLDTEKEKDWYVGLGTNNKETMVNGNSTLFIGGFPKGSWKSIKSNSGYIYSQQRYIPKEEPGFTQSFWTKYNEVDNQKYNHYRGYVDWYKNHFTSPSMTNEQNTKYMQHGMQIKKVLQQSYISFSNLGGHKKEDTLIDGASGSMIINSRGEITGLLFQGITSTIDNDDGSETQLHANLGVLFKNYSRDNNFSIIQQVQKMLQNKGFKTLKLNP